LSQIETNLIEDIGSVSNWCSKNQMSLHIGKTKTMLVTNRQKRTAISNKKININFNDTPIECVDNFKVLGMIIDNNLSWSAHIESIRKSVCSKLFLLSRIRHLLPFSSRKQFYNSFILPHFDYCSNIWYFCSQEDMNCLKRLQKRAMRLILNVSMETPTVELFRRLNWFPIDYRIKFNFTVLVYKSLNNYTPKYLEVFDYKKGKTRAVTSHELSVKFAHKNLYKHSFNVSGANLFNQLPQTIRGGTIF
jgi:hypothetical protein